MDDPKQRALHAVEEAAGRDDEFAVGIQLVVGAIGPMKGCASHFAIRILASA